MARQREDPRRTAREQVGAFLSAHRGLVSPQQAGLPSGIGHRRVQGLRREEVALLAGISVEYYAKLERGAIGDVSPQVVDALARVLQLSTAEREHLDRLVHTSSGWVAPAVASRTQVVVRPELQRVLEGRRSSGFPRLTAPLPGRRSLAQACSGRREPGRHPQGAHLLWGT